MKTDTARTNDDFSVWDKARLFETSGGKLADEVSFGSGLR